MKRAPLYSGRNRTRKADATAIQPDDNTGDASGAPPKPPRIRNFFRRHQSPALFVAALAVAGLTVLVYRANQTPPREFVQEDIDAAVLHTLENKTMPSKAS